MFAGVIHPAVQQALSKHQFYQEKVNARAVFTSYLDALNSVTGGEGSLKLASKLDEEEKNTLQIL